MKGEEYRIACPSLSIVIPTFEEPALREWLVELRARYSDAEIIVVDDSSVETRANAASAAADVQGVFLAGPRRGKGAAVRSGLIAATAEIIAVVDADLDPPTMKRIADLAALAKEGNDLVIGERTEWRFHSALRFLLSLVLFVAQRFFIFHSSRFFDTQCGCKVYRRDAARQVASLQRVDGGMYDIEHLYIAIQKGMRIRSVPLVPWKETRPSRLRIARCLWTDPADLLRVKWNGIRRRYS
jgi:dolichyl-phosphate beta-glucosyltransferase